MTFPFLHRFERCFGQALYQRRHAAYPAKARRASYEERASNRRHTCGSRQRADGNDGSASPSPRRHAEPVSGDDDLMALAWADPPAVTPRGHDGAGIRHGQPATDGHHANVRPARDIPDAGPAAPDAAADACAGRHGCRGSARETTEAIRASGRLRSITWPGSVQGR